MVSWFPETEDKSHNQLRRAMEVVTSLSYPTLFLIWLSMAFFFAVLYFVLGYFPGHGPMQLESMELMQRFANCLYYSIITATSTGYGDIVPQGVSKILASVQSIGALFIFAVFVTKLVAHRQEVALKQIHKLTFEDVFHNIREGFYIVRKDLDRISVYAKENNALREKEWIDLATAYRQAQSFLRRILDFYDPLNRLYTIDARREELLRDGVYRTFDRIDHLLSTLSNHKIDWEQNNESKEELHELINLCHYVLTFWRENSPHKQYDGFDQLMLLHDDLKKKIGE